MFDHLNQNQKHSQNSRNPKSKRTHDGILRTDGRELSTGPVGLYHRSDGVGAIRPAGGAVVRGCRQGPWQWGGTEGTLVNEPREKAFDNCSVSLPLCIQALVTPIAKSLVNEPREKRGVRWLKRLRAGKWLRFGPQPLPILIEPYFTHFFKQRSMGGECGAGERPGPSLEGGVPSA